jgi:hypothetical protein
MWLYSSNYNNNWWIYDNDSNNKIEKIYKDYILKQEMGSASNNSNLVISDDIKIKLNNIKSRKQSKSLNKLTNSNDKFEELILDNTSYEFNIEFNEIENNNDTSSTKTDTSIVNTIIPPEPLSYIIKCGAHEYRIDFDSMKQINVDDTWRKRSIKRIEIPEDVCKTNLNAIISYLLSKNILGINGEKIIKN